MEEGTGREGAEGARRSRPGDRGDAPLQAGPGCGWEKAARKWGGGAGGPPACCPGRPGKRCRVLLCFAGTGGACCLGAGGEAAECWGRCAGPPAWSRARVWPERPEPWTRGRRPRTRGAPGARDGGRGRPKGPREGTSRSRASVKLVQALKDPGCPLYFDSPVSNDQREFNALQSDGCFASATWELRKLVQTSQQAVRPTVPRAAPATA
ncbi:uncharacterized protein LOC121501399 [Vulpes lagopus]|uniref:uncharacterized protein LOC121501399 n=1 Tax=Vulpes lagopus TaxID=494514 RepID=UPI001BC975C7|nr:uncharacterized protein LOC121501399 [Vulpes lagopus]